MCIDNELFCVSDTSIGLRLNPALAKNPSNFNFLCTDQAEEELKKFPCPNCPSVYSRKSGLLCHQRYECNQTPHFKCPHCDLLSKKSSNIQKHIRRKHPGLPVHYVFI